MTTVTDLATLDTRLAETVAAAALRCEDMAFEDQADWAIRDGVLSHHTGGFFQVVGFQRAAGGPQELMLYQPQNALNGVLVCRHGGRLWFLLQMRVEPGNTRIGNLGPTIQSTAANYMRLHGGKPTTHLDLFQTYCPGITPIVHNSQMDFGGIYIHKTKSLRVVMCDEMIDPGRNMIWVSDRTMAEALAQDYLINTDLRALLPSVDWDAVLGVPAPPAAAAPGDSAFYEAYRRAFRPGARPGRFLPLDQLRDWTIGRTGIEDTAGRGTWVRLYEVTATNREVASWTQPLMHAACDGLVVLCTRQGANGQEVLVTLSPEPGVNGGVAMGPTRHRRPGTPPAADEPDPAGLGRVTANVRMSEEGGRFYRFHHRYVVADCPADTAPVPGPDQHWISLAAFAATLQSSDRSMMELRIVASLLAPALCPACFADAGPPG